MCQAWHSMLGRQAPHGCSLVGPTEAPRIRVTKGQHKDLWDQITGALTPIWGQERLPGGSLSGGSHPQEELGSSSCVPAGRREGQRLRVRRPDHCLGATDCVTRHQPVGGSRRGGICVRGIKTPLNSSGFVEPGLSSISVPLGASPGPTRCLGQ